MGFRAPRLLYEGRGVAVHEFIDGVVLEDAFPRSTPLPDWVPIAMARQMAAIHRLELEVLGNELQPVITVESVKKHILDLYDDFSPELRRCFQDLSFLFREYLLPDCNLCDWLSIRIVFAHCDAHRKNSIVSKDKALTLIDWELAKFVPLEYALASHLHRMDYTTEQEQIFLANFSEVLSIDVSSQECLSKIDFFRNLEVIKSLIVDTGRYWSHLRFLDRDDARELAESYARKYIKMKRACLSFNFHGSYESLQCRTYANR